MSDLRLRSARVEDARFLHELTSGGETRPFLGRVPATFEEVVAEIEACEREPGERGWLVFEVDGAPGGCAAYHVVNERNRIVEVGRFAVHPGLRGCGLGVEAARLVQRHLLVELDFHRLELQIYGFNVRAIAHAERCGYVREGVKRRAYTRNGEWHDAVLFALLQEDL
ncbi:MAG: GNAT family N-acetyltransferase [Gaiellaceae bacterium]